jgi:hypothetical protein
MWPLSIGLPSRVLPSCVVQAFDATLSSFSSLTSAVLEPSSTKARSRKKMPLAIRPWTCPDCGTLHDRDVHAARNLLAYGLAALSGSTASCSAECQACGRGRRWSSQDDGETGLSEAGSKRRI